MQDQSTTRVAPTVYALGYVLRNALLDLILRLKPAVVRDAAGPDSPWSRLAAHREQIVHQAVVALVPARLRGREERERRVLVVRDAVQGIHHEDEAHRSSGHRAWRQSAFWCAPHGPRKQG